MKVTMPSLPIEKGTKRRKVSKSIPLGIFNDIPHQVLGVVASHLSLPRLVRAQLPAAFTTHSLLHIDDLPESVLANVASYLSKTTRALLAVAFTAPSSSWEQKDWKNASPSESSKIVLANPYHGLIQSARRYCYERSGSLIHNGFNEEWQVIDFMDVEEGLRMRLTDGDLRGLLVCIDAVNNSMILKLPQCIEITGSGLAPLSGSTVLSKLDLSVMSVEFEKSNGLKIKISEDAVIPILSSIMEKSGSALKHLHLPKVWHDNRSEALSQFMRLYCSGDVRWYFEESRRNTNCLCLIRDDVKIDCVGCSHEFYFDSMSKPKSPIVSCEGSKQTQSCLECKRIYCESHAEYSINTCPKCKKTKCDGCSSFFWCNCCDQLLCEDCEENLRCERDCVGNDEVSNCTGCAMKDDAGTKRCVRCNQTYCWECRPMQFMQSFEGNVCAECQ